MWQRSLHVNWNPWAVLRSWSTAPNWNCYNKHDNRQKTSSLKDSGIFLGTRAHSAQLILLSERLARKPNFRLPVFAKQLPSQARGQNRLLLITKKYYPLVGGFATTWVSKANRYDVFRSLVPCTAAIPNPGPQILLQQIREEWGRVGAVGVVKVVVGGCYLHAPAS